MSELSVSSTSLIIESTPPQSKTVILLIFFLAFLIAWYLRPFPFSPWRMNKSGFLQSISSLRTNKVTLSADTWYLCYSFLKKKKPEILVCHLTRSSQIIYLLLACFFLHYHVKLTCLGLPFKWVWKGKIYLSQMTRQDFPQGLY